MRDIYITKCELEEENSISKLHIYGRDSAGEADDVIVEDYHPYFYVPSHCEVGERDNSSILNVSEGFKSLFGDSLDKVTMASHWDVREFRESFAQTFESDVWYTTRARVDLDLHSGVSVPSGERRVSVDDIEPVELSQDMRTMTIDIETDDRGAFPEPGEKRILSIAAHDSHSGFLNVFVDLDGRTINETFPEGKPEGCDVVQCVENERKLLAKFAHFVSEVNPDVLTAWNVEFDLPYIVARMNEIGVDPARMARDGRALLKDNDTAVIGGRTIYDLLYAYKKTKRAELDSYKLDSVAKAELGEAKIDHTGVGFFELYQENPDKFVRYNARDVDLAVRINEEAGVFDFKQALSDEVGVDFENTKDNHQLIEMFARRKLDEKGLVGPDARHDHGNTDYEGAYVFEPHTGIAENVAGVDLSSLYPMTMKMFNMSPETKLVTNSQVENHPHVTSPGTGVHFRTDEPGIFADLVDDAIGLKSEYKAKLKKVDPESEEYDALSERYLAAKTITNSIYGVLGWSHFFLYDREVAESVTLAGQECIKQTQRFVDEDTDGSVVYGDTDSNYVKFPDHLTVEEVVTEAKEVCELLNFMVYPELGREFGVHPSDCEWFIELESVAKRFFQHGRKKRYAEHVVWKEGKDVDKVTIVGYQRSDVPEVTQDLIDDVLEEIVRSGDESELCELVYEAAGEISADGGNLDRIGIPGGIRKKLGEYAQSNGKPQGAHPRAAYNSNELLNTNFGSGTKPKRVYLSPKATEIGEIDVIAFDTSEQVPSELRRIDVSRMTDVAIVNPLGDVLSAVGVDINAAIRGQQQTGLTAYM